MYFRVLKNSGRVIALSCVAVTTLALAQTAAKPAAKTPAADSASKWDIFAGYSYIKPSGTVDTPLPADQTGANGGTLPVGYVQIVGGGIGSVARYFNHYIGLEAVGDIHLQNEHPGAVWTVPADDMSGASLGVILRAPKGSWTPFVHVLAGGERVAGPHWQLETWGPSATAGGGIDYTTNWFHRHLAIRLIQADYQYAHADFGPTTHNNPPPSIVGTFGGVANINAIRLSTGLVYRSKGAEPVPITLTAVATPTTVYPGDPVTVTATAENVAPKLNTVYSWQGAEISGGNGSTITVETGDLSPGSHTLKAQVKEGKHGKEGRKAWEVADASANFTVKQFEPPTVGCTVNPSTIKPGESASVAAAGVSPQNRPLTYSYAATAGAVTGSGSSATYVSTGAPTGTVGITCTVADDKGQSANSTTNLSVLQPPPPPVPHTEALGNISFAHDKKRPTRVDNEAKAILDGVALRLQKQPDAKAVVVGEANATERAQTAKEAKAALKNKHAKVDDLAAERAVNTKDYLVTEKGIDPSRVIVRTGNTDGQLVEDYLVPAGADFDSDVTGTSPVDETTVKPQYRKTLTIKTAHKTTAAKAVVKKTAARVARKKAAMKKTAARVVKHKKTMLKRTSLR